jgi:hypothetical protein
MFGKIFESMEDLVDEQFRALHSVERTNLHRPPLSLGPHERTKCVRFNALCEIWQLYP